MIKKINIEFILYFLIFLILSLFTIKISLSLDDFNLVFPAIYGNYLTHFQNYIRDFGLFRPLALLYYYSIYTIYLQSPWIAHLIPLAIVGFSAFLLSKTLKLQGLTKNQSFASGLLFSSIPFVVESYSWLIANISLIVIAVFFIQIYLIEKNTLNKNLLKTIISLQLISALIYETTIFMSFPIAYLLYISKRETNKLKLFLFSFLPLFIYFLTKLIIKPQFDLRSKFINFSEAFSNWNSSLLQLKTLLSNNYLSNFWKKEVLDGFNLITSNLLILILSILLFLLLLRKLFKRNEDAISIKNEGARMYFWLFCFITSLAPLTWQKGYLPFRTLVLPSTILIVLIFFIFNKTIKYKSRPLEYLFKLFFTFVVVIFLTVQVSMLNQYLNQFLTDKKIALEINKKLEDLGFEHPYRSNLYLKKFNRNNSNRLLYGDYLFTNFNYYWSAEALLDLNSGSFGKVAIEFPLDKNFTSNVSKDDFLKLRPLTIMSFIDNESCLTGECLKIEAVYQKPY